MTGKGCQIGISNWFEEQESVDNRYLPFGEQGRAANSYIVF